MTTAAPVFDYEEQLRIVAEMYAKDWFFVTGIPKSGSTWLTILLNAHPEVSCLGEGHFLTALAPELKATIDKYNAYIRHKNQQVLQGLIAVPQLQGPHLGFLLVSSIALMLATSGKARSVRVVGEKTPGRMDNLASLQALFPHAKFVHIVRDPRDCTVSAWFHNLRVTAAALQSEYRSMSAFVPHSMRVWVRGVTAWEHFSATRSAHCVTVRYEDLVAQSSVELYRLFRFLGVATDAATIAGCIAAGDFTRLSGGRQPGMEDRASLLRQGLPGDWRGHFSPEDASVCQSIAGATMARFGYSA